MWYDSYMARKDQLVNGEVYHVINRSIAGYKIFNNDLEFSRFIDTFRFYQHNDLPYSISRLYKLPIRDRSKTLEEIVTDQNTKMVEIIAFAIMPTHIHFILKQMIDAGISKFMANISNSYAKYFNLTHKRSGHLWQNKFKNIRVGSDEQLMHLTRYIHLNPTSAGIVKKPQDWLYSSYREYLGKVKGNNRICQFDELFNISPKDYRKFVNDRKEYQKELSKIKALLLDDYTG